MCDAYVPVPDSARICGLVRAESLIVKVPVRVPVAIGEKITLIVQFAPIASFLGQVLVSAKSFGSAPLIVMLVIFSGVAPGLVSVTSCAALVVPTFCAAKVRLLDPWHSRRD